MNEPGRLRERLVQRLNTAYAGGLISDQTLVARLDQVLNRTLVDPQPLVGDLWLRDRRGVLHNRVSQVRAAVRSTIEAVFEGESSEDGSLEQLLALDWDHAAEAIVIGRSSRCDVVLTEETVSRRHARLSHRDGCWILQDLDSTNGSYLNGRRVGRCELRPGDRLHLGEASLRVD